MKLSNVILSAGVGGINSTSKVKCPFERLIKQYDFEEAFFYCDPPYSCGCGYEVTTTEGFDHERLREVLGNIQGRFLLSYDDCPKIRELYKGYEMIEVERLNGMQYNFHPTQKIKQKPDGTVTVNFKASGEKEIIWHVFKWGRHCKILAPKSLKEYYKQYLSENLNNY